MLLLVMQAQNNAPRGFVIHVDPKEFFHRAVHMLAERDHLIQRRTRKGGAQALLRRRFSNRVVVAVEEPAKLFAERLVTGKKRPQHERFKKPGGMRLMPLHWARFRRG